MGKLLNLQGQSFGRLLVLERAGSDKNKKALWECECSCGNHIITRGTDLNRGKSLSCGCFRSEKYIEDLSGQRFGKLTAIKATDKRNHRSVVWECLCDCGRTCWVDNSRLVSLNTQSCGCLSSLGEVKIKDYLQKYEIDYKEQYSFNDLRGENNTFLRFDFGILKENQLICLIEFQGIQHYQNVYNLTDEKWKSSINRDQCKRIYCIEHNIPLYEIKYDEDIIDSLERVLCY